MQRMIKRIAFAASLLVLTLMTAHAQDIRKGLIMQVKPDSIWFQDRAMLTRWQHLKAGGGEAFKTFQDEKLASRDAWQFTYPLKVRVTRYDAASHQADVEMHTPGRMFGTPWLLDESAFEKSR